MTDIAEAAIKWLCDDPTFSPSDHVSISEALQSLGAEDPEDPLLLALVAEGVQQARGSAAAPVTIAGWQPELCGDDANRRVCNEPVSGTGRCMTCGSQRLEPEKPSAAIKAAQLSDQEPTSEEHCLMCKRLLNQPDDPLSLDCGGDCWGCVGEVEGAFDADPPRGHGSEALNEDAAKLEALGADPGLTFEDLEPERVVHVGPAEVPHRSQRSKRLKRKATIKAHIHIDAPSAPAIELVRQRVLEAVNGALPMMHRIKNVTGLSDQELGSIVGRSRATIQAYAQTNRNEVLGPNQLQALADVLRVHYDVLGDLLLELEALKCPSEN